jgi:hypothetical protein
VSQEGVPAGYEAISLVEALNGQVVLQNGHPDGKHKKWMKYRYEQTLFEYLIGSTFE